MLINTITGRYPMQPYEVVNEVGGITLPTEETLPDGYAWVTAVPMPAHDSAIEQVVELPPVLEDGKYKQVFEVVALSEEVIQGNIAAARANKNAEINAARLAANFSTFVSQGKVFACDALSRSDIDGANGFVALTGALPPGWPGGWKAVDNTYIAIPDIAAWEAFYGSMFAAGNANFAKAQSLKATLAAAQTVQEIAAIRW